MANKRISDLPAETDPSSSDVFAVDGATTRKTTRANVLKENLEAIRALASAADKGIQFTGAGTAAVYDLTAAGKALLDDADASAQRTTLGLAIGTNVQAYNAKLADLAGITYAQGDILYFNGTNIVNLGPGTSGYFLKTQGAAANPVWASIPGGGDLLSTNNLNDVANKATSLANLGGLSTRGSQTFTSSGTFTTPANSTTATVYRYRIQAGGGGGGGSNGAAAAAGGGGNGAYAEGTFTGVAPSTGITVTVGAAGAAGNSSGTSGTAGTTSSLGSPVSISCSGGAGSTGTTTVVTAGGAGGTVTGSPNIIAIAGRVGTPGVAAASSIAGGDGSSSMFGNGGIGGRVGASSAALSAGTGYGAGGAGGSGSTGAGSAGSAGIVIIDWVL